MGLCVGVCGCTARHHGLLCAALRCRCAEDDLPCDAVPHPPIAPHLEHCDGSAYVVSVLGNAAVQICKTKPRMRRAIVFIALTACVLGASATAGEGVGLLC